MLLERARHGTCWVCHEATRPLHTGYCILTLMASPQGASPRAHAPFTSHAHRQRACGSQMRFTQQPLEIPSVLPSMSSKQHDELESEMTGFLSALPAKLICEIALRCPIRSFRRVVRFDVQSVACTRIQRWYRSWSLNTLSQKSEARAVNVCSATPTCRAEGTTPPTSLPSAFLPFKFDGKCLPDAASWLEHGCDVLRARACGPPSKGRGTQRQRGGVEEARSRSAALSVTADVHGVKVSGSFA